MAALKMSRKQLARWILAGPGAIAVAVSVLIGMPVWFPAGAADVNHIMMPMVLAPAVWGLAFFYAVLSDRLWRVGIVFTLLLASHVWFAISSGGWT